MGHANSQVNPSKQYFSAYDLSKRETANYIYDILGSIQELALDKHMPALAGMITCARAEAKSQL